MLCDYLTNSNHGVDYHVVSPREFLLIPSKNIPAVPTWYHPSIATSQLPGNHSIPERTTDLKSHGQFESIDFLNFNHFTQQGFRSPRRITDGELRSH